MKKLLLLFVFMLGIILPSIVSSQVLLLDSVSNQSYSFSCEGTLFDEGGENNNYENNKDYWRTICPVYSNHRLSLTFEEFNIHPSDRLEIYSGNSLGGLVHSSTTGQPYFTNQELLNQTIKAHYIDSTGCLTIRLVSDSSNTSSGFKANIQCLDYCQSPFARLENYFIKIDPQGQMQTFPIKDLTDTIYSPSTNSFIIENYKSIDICKGDSVILVARPLFPDNNMPYSQNSSNCIYQWSFGDGQTQTVFYNNTVGYKWIGRNVLDINLIVTDTNAICSSSNNLNTKIRISINKIKEIAEDLKICSSDRFYFSTGYQEENTITLRNNEINRKFGYEGALFIPDGPSSSIQGIEPSVIINQFPSNSIIRSKDDILSVCMNIEHSYVGDISLELICPNGQSTILKHFIHNSSSDLGIPNTTTYGCDSINNPQGIGWNYCFSNQLLTNSRGVITGNVSSQIDSTNIYSQSGYFQTPLQSATFPYYEMVDSNGFSSLIGCPMNGEWKLRIIDYWSSQNGYLFSWNIEFSEESVSELINFSLFDSINLIGDGVTRISATDFQISMPDISPGTINYGVEIIDDFGCKWDTVVGIRVLQGSIVDFGTSDTTIFEPIELSVPYQEGNSYIWYPSQDTTNSITTPIVETCDSIIDCYVVASRVVENLQCVSTGYIQILNNPTPLTPTQITAQVNQGNITINWISNALTYEVYRDDIFVSTVNQPLYIDTNIIEEQTYCYKIKALNNNCESEISGPLCKTNVGLNPITDNSPNITLYPNPTNSKTKIQVEGLETKAEIKLYDIQGKKLRTYTLQPNQNQLEIDLNCLSKGVYNIKIETNKYSITKKLILTN